MITTGVSDVRYTSYNLLVFSIKTLSRKFVFNHLPSVSRHNSSWDNDEMTRNEPICRIIGCGRRREMSGPMILSWEMWPQILSFMSAIITIWTTGLNDESFLPYFSVGHFHNRHCWLDVQSGESFRPQVVVKAQLFSMEWSSTSIILVWHC
jgi:hypothetical protein